MAAAAFQPLQPVHGEEQTWAAPAWSAKPAPQQEAISLLSVSGKAPPGFAQMGKSRHGQVARDAFDPEGEAQRSYTPP